MSGLAAVLAGRRAPGVHRWESHLDVDTVQDAIVRAGWRFVHVDTIAVEMRDDLLAVIGEGLGFPEYYGRNLDALHDCLRDLPSRTVLLWEGWGTPALAVPAAFSAVTRVFADHAAEGGMPVQVLLRGAGPAEAHIALLD